MARHNRSGRIGVGAPKNSSKKPKPDSNAKKKEEASKSIHAPSAPASLITTEASPPETKRIDRVNLLEKYVNLAKEVDEPLQGCDVSPVLVPRAKHDIIDVPMEYRAQVQGRCQRQYFKDMVEGKLKDHAQGSSRPAISHWIDEWRQFAVRKIPFTSDGVNLLPDDQAIQIDWRLISNSGVDEGFIRPVIAAGGWPLIPGSSIKGLFRCACREIAPMRVMAWCGGETANGESQPGLLRFHGAWPADEKWKNQLLDVAHPQQKWQVGIQPDDHSANAVVSLHEPRLNIAVSSTDPQLKEDEWKEIRSVLRHALGRGIGGRTCAGYGSSGLATQELLFECSLQGQGPAPKLLDGTPEFRPNMFRAAIRGMALRLFGGITDAKTAREAVGFIFGSIDPEDGENACVGLVASFFKKDVLDDPSIVPFRHKQNAYSVAGRLQWRLLRSRRDGEVEELRQLIQILHGLVMTLGGFGRGWRRPDHRIFFPAYYTESKNRKFPPPPLIGCHWQWRDSSSLPSLLQIQTPEDLKRLLQAARSLAQRWLGKTDSSPGRAIEWREVIHPNHLYIWTREAECRDHAVAIHWFHKQAANSVDSSEDNDPLKLKGTPLAGFVASKQQMVSHIWNRLLPLQPVANSVVDEGRKILPQPASLKEAIQRPTHNLNRNKPVSPISQPAVRELRGRRPYRAFDNVSQGPFLEIVLLNLPDARNREFQSFIKVMDDGAGANFKRLKW